MKPQPARVKLTYDDFLLFPDDGKRHELIDGEHYVTAAPYTAHQVIVGNLYFIIAAFLKQQPVGRVFLSPFDVVFSNFDVVEPDLLYISTARMEILTAKHVRGSPDLVIEVLSRGTRRTDEVIKRRLYDRAQVHEYWIVDLVRETLRVWRRDADGLSRAGEYARAAGDVFTTPLLDGLRIALEAVFEQT